MQLRILRDILTEVGQMKGGIRREKRVAQGTQESKETERDDDRGRETIKWPKGKNTTLEMGQLASLN